MSDTLALIGGETPQDPIVWVRVSAQGAQVERGVSTQAPPSALGVRRTVLVTPAADAQVKRLDLPARTEAQARAGAAALFEGALATNIGDAHFAVGAPQNQEGARLAVAMDGRRLREWLNACAGFGCEPDAVYLDCLLWPTARGEIDVVETPTRAIIAAGEWGGFSFDPALAPAVFARWLAQPRQTVHMIRVYGGEARRWSDALGAGAPPIAQAEPRDAIEVLAACAADPPASAPNLRQGDFSRAARAASPLRMWRFAAMLAFIAVALQIGAMAVSGARDAAAAQATMSAAERAFREAHPEVRRIVNLRAQVAALKNAAAQAQNHPVLAANNPVIAVLQAHPGVRMDEARHDAPGREVRMIWSAAEQATLQAALEALRAGAGAGAVDADSIRIVDGRAVARLTVRTP